MLNQQIAHRPMIWFFAIMQHIDDFTVHLQVTKSLYSDLKESLLTTEMNHVE